MYRKQSILQANNFLIDSLVLDLDDTNIERSGLANSPDHACTDNKFHIHKTKNPERLPEGEGPNLKIKPIIDFWNSGFQMWSRLGSSNLKVAIAHRWQL